VNTACQGKLPACHFGHACHRFGRSGILSNLVIIPNYYYDYYCYHYRRRRRRHHRHHICATDCSSLLPAPTKLPHSFVFPALIFQLRPTHRHLFLLGHLFSFPPTCISCGFLTKILVQSKGFSIKPNHRLVDQASVFMSPGTGWYSYTPAHKVSTLVASYDMRGLEWDYSFLRCALLFCTLLATLCVIDRGNMWRMCVT